MYKYLKDIKNPNDVKNLNKKELPMLCEDIRAFLIDSVSNTGGHLSSNLGTIEVSVAMHKIFTTPKDNIIFDVGHQCYTHKLLTGRMDKFDKLRQLNGLSGFPAPKESEHDAFIAGHGNTAISAAIGMASAKNLKGEPGKVIAFVGDGAFTGGMVYEGMNNVRDLNNLIVILNDNEMSISKNVGSVSNYFTHLRTSPKYFATKRIVQNVLDGIPLVGKPIRRTLQKIKTSLRQRLYHSTLFENMGFQYVGPVDGHNVIELCDLFSAYNNEQYAPLFIHLLSTKGKGYVPAEKNPGEFHGVSAFDSVNLTDPDFSSQISFSSKFGEHLSNLANKDDKICAITAAMKYGTGLQYFYRRHKTRFFDVGMAEQHAVTFAAGLAAAKMKPVVAIYSTFLQRAYDQIIHDVNLQKLNVLFAIDRAGFVVGDGETHQGIYDAAFLSQLTGVKVISPCNFNELEFWLTKLIDESGVRAIRYPRGDEDTELAKLPCSQKEYDVFSFGEKQANIACVTYGAQTAPVIKAARLSADNNVGVDVFKMCQIHPLPQSLATELDKYSRIVFAEEGIKSGGIGEHLLCALNNNSYKGKYLHIAANSNEFTHASVDELREIFKLDEQSLLKVFTSEK